MFLLIYFLTSDCGFAGLTRWGLLVVLTSEKRKRRKGRCRKRERKLEKQGEINIKN